MTPHIEGPLSLTRLGGKYPAIIFIIVLIAFVAESQLTQVCYHSSFYSLPLSHSLHKYVQSTLHFRQPFFLLCVFFFHKHSFTRFHLTDILPSFVVHTAFALIFPLHLLFLVLTVPVSVESLLAGLSLAVKVHFSPNNQDLLTTLRSPFPHVHFLKLIALLTLALSIPSVLWFVSVSLSP
jgi:hypothetical protein